MPVNDWVNSTHVPTGDIEIGFAGVGVDKEFFQANKMVTLWQ
jgi:hypothetical protein